MPGMARGIAAIPKRQYGYNRASSGSLHAPPALAEQPLHPQGCLVPPHAAHQGSPNTHLQFHAVKSHLDGMHSTGRDFWTLYVLGLKATHGPRGNHSTTDLLFMTVPLFFGAEHSCHHGKEHFHLLGLTRGQNLNLKHYKTQCKTWSLLLVEAERTGRLEDGKEWLMAQKYQKS